MRHRKQGRKLSRTASHRQAMRRNLAAALLRHERVITTVAKAKETAPFVQRLITLARRAQPFKNTGRPEDRAQYLALYRRALQRLQDKEMVQKLFGEGPWLAERESLAVRYADRQGGYCRIVRLSGSRLGIVVGDKVGKVPSLTYQVAGTERELKLVGNRLGDNAPLVLFELVEKEEAREEVAPTVTTSQPGKEPAQDSSRR